MLGAGPPVGVYARLQSIQWVCRRDCSRFSGCVGETAVDSSSRTTLERSAERSGRGEERVMVGETGPPAGADDAVHQLYTLL